MKILHVVSRQFGESRVGFKGGNGKGGICIWLPVHCLSMWTGNGTVAHMRHPLLVEERPKLCATIARQYTVGAWGRCDIVLSSQSPRKCRFPLFAYPLFKLAKESLQELLREL